MHYNATRWTCSFFLEGRQNIPLSESRDDLQDELNALREGRKALPKGERLTAIWDALATADAEFDSHQEGDAIYAITDGGENASKLKMNSLRKTLLEKRIRLFTYLGFTFIGGPEFNGGLDLIDLSDATGGVGISTRRNDVGMLPALAYGSGAQLRFPFVNQLQDGFLVPVRDDLQFERPGRDRVADPATWVP